MNNVRVGVIICDGYVRSRSVLWGKEDADENGESCSSLKRKVFVVNDPMVKKTDDIGVRILMELLLEKQLICCDLLITSSSFLFSWIHELI